MRSLNKQPCLSPFPSARPPQWSQYKATELTLGHGWLIALIGAAAAAPASVLLLILAVAPAVCQPRRSSWLSDELFASSSLPPAPRDMQLSAWKVGGGGRGGPTAPAPSPLGGAPVNAVGEKDVTGKSSPWR